jgi:hypothetical protein
MTLDASGNLLVGTTTSSNRTITVGLSIALADANGGIYFGATGTPVGSGGFGVNAAIARAGGTNFHITGSADGDLCIAPEGTKAILFGTSASASSVTERARITSGGDLLVGSVTTATSSSAGFKVLGSLVSGHWDPTVVTDSNSASASCWDIYSTATGSYRFYVTTTGVISAVNTTISAISDVRFKENIQDLDVGLDKIMALKPRKFDWKEGKGKNIKGDRGWIAQEFEQVFPDMIDTWRDPAPEGEEPYKSVRADLIPVMVKAIQELKAEVDSLKAQLEAK